jgi:cellobiose phosphorylase
MSANKNLIIRNSPGLSIDFLDNGSVKFIEAAPIRISLKPATPFSKSGTNIWLRKRGEKMEFHPLLGPNSDSRFNVSDDSFIAKGSWAGIDFKCILQLSQKSLSWQWCIEIKNTTGEPVDLDLIYLQDVGLKPITGELINEYYVSQYLERRILEDKTYGSVICCRQNTRESVGYPWLMMVCETGSIAASTDGMQFYDKTYRETGIPECLLTEKLGGEYSGESSVVALQETPFSLASGKNRTTRFTSTYVHDHPQATSEEDLKLIPGLIQEFTYDVLSLITPELTIPDKNIFNTSLFFPSEDLDDEELMRFFDKERRHSEIENGRLLSFFNNENNHVVLRAKEVIVDRPHGHIIQAQARLSPDENIVSTTCYAGGIFNSHLTQGNTNFNILLSVCTDQFNQSAGSGQRIFVGINDRYYLLGVPSAFEMGLNHCRWIYKHGNYCFQVRTWTSKTSPRVNMDFKVVNGSNVKLVITHDFDKLNGWNIVPGNEPGEYIAKSKEDSMISKRFPNAQFRMIINSDISSCEVTDDRALYTSHRNHDDYLLVLNVKETSVFGISFIGEVSSAYKADRVKDPDQQWHSDCTAANAFLQELNQNLTLIGNHKDIDAIQEILPWYSMNALTHFLTPYGLEQFGGAAWGTRDISQGPFDLLLCMEKYEDALMVLRIIFSNQNSDGGWPQWWMFDSYTNIRADSSHGDIFYWCLIALGNYIRVTGKMDILNEKLPYYNEKGSAFSEITMLSEHADRLIKMIVDSFIPGTSLVPFGGGDWNDSLQPVSKELASRMISSWTVEMNYQAFNQYRLVYELAGKGEKAKELENICARIREDFNKYLVKDGIVAGYGLVEEDSSISLMLHPSDNKTGIRYSILPMERGIISGIFTKEQALHHLDLIEQHLKGPDGARLMDLPLKYRGGIQTIFQRAESSTFFGREIGLMYVHEHIRYAEALAVTGKADEFVKALRQAIPVDYRDIVPCGDFRQANCYYSSSDVSFRNRYEADEHYDEIKTGKITLKGGWRIYSSGPGIYVSLIVTRLIGLRTESGKTILDPVLPKYLNGLSASINYSGFPVKFVFDVSDSNCGPKAITINGKGIKFAYEDNKYRRGGAIILTDRFLSMLNRHANTVEIEL